MEEKGHKIPSLLSQLMGKREGLWHWVWESPLTEGNKGQRFLRATFRILFIVYKEFKRNAVTLRASALTYTVILSLVPMLALGTALLKGLGAGNQMRQAAYEMIHKLEEMEKEGKGQPPPATLKGKGTQKTGKPLSSHLRLAVDKVFDYVDHTNFATLGAFGILGLLLTVISVFSKIEESLNAIWRTPRGRPLGRKVMDYLALMILFPIALNVGLAATAALESPTLLSKINHILPFPWLWTLFLSLLPLLVIIATFATLYRFIPNTRVDLKSSLVGGIVGGLGWILVQALYMKLQIGVAKYNAIYGSFATLPLFLLWVYLGWVTFLGGAEMAYAMSTWKTYLPRGEERTPVFSLALAYDIMDGLYQAFKERKVPTERDIAQKMGQPEGVVIPIISKLKERGLIRNIQGEEEGLLPSAPPQEIPAWEIVEAVCGQETPSTLGGLWAKRALEAMKERLYSKKLSGLITHENESPAKEQKDEYL